MLSQASVSSWGLGGSASWGWGSTLWEGGVYGNTVYARSVRILMECILVFVQFSGKIGQTKLKVDTLELVPGLGNPGSATASAVEIK